MEAATLQRPEKPESPRDFSAERARRRLAISRGIPLRSATGAAAIPVADLQRSINRALHRAGRLDAPA